eukprot:CAMPEP_0177648864 /NCGR_PEP_ID=MMETSP0447-20121125/11060_1 /TAXON_ID=0 /ORGANISM="Stygamoeba regulata, Strain BSH-02190019" /LENGTH=92 /DNA_ID=CAMNT_0019151543 /DNA_START=238 /DNA_END=516 /DNA_ORIENTATION=-
MMDAEDDLGARQAANAEQRLKYLQFWASRVGSPVVVTLTDGLEVSATLAAADGQVSSLLLADVQTPAFRYPHAVISTCDVVSCTFPQKDVAS